jgi:hypothetical protein
VNPAHETHSNESDSHHWRTFPLIHGVMAFHDLGESHDLHRFDPILCAILCASGRIGSAGFSTQEWVLSYEIVRPNDSRKQPCITPPSSPSRTTPSARHR